MKEVMAFIRMNKINETKEALAQAGFPAFTCRKVMGRGKKIGNPVLVDAILQEGELPVSPLGESFTESVRLLPKRFFTLIVKDEDVEIVVDTIMEINHTGNSGDGKIFVINIEEAFRIRTGQHQADSESY